jgi:hypothetical protein
MESSCISVPPSSGAISERQVIGIAYLTRCERVLASGRNEFTNPAHWAEHQWDIKNDNQLFKFNIAANGPVTERCHL